MLSQEEIISTVEKNYPETCKMFKQLQQEDYALFCRKQHDYGPYNISLGTSLEKEEDIKASLCGITFRLHDKMQRLLNIIVKKGVVSSANEPVTDAFVDMGIYSTIARIVTAGKWCK
jgi:hypothetical protein